MRKGFVFLCVLTALLTLLTLPSFATETTEHGGHGGSFDPDETFDVEHGGHGGHFGPAPETASDSDIASVVSLMKTVTYTNLWKFIAVGFSIVLQFAVVFYVVNKA